MTPTGQLTVERVVVQSTRSYEEVKAALEERMGVLENTEELRRRLASTHPSWDEVTKIVEKRLGSSGFSIFSKVEQGQLLSLLGIAKLEYSARTSSHQASKPVSCHHHFGSPQARPFGFRSNEPAHA